MYVYVQIGGVGMGSINQFVLGQLETLLEPQ